MAAAHPRPTRQRAFAGKRSTLSLTLKLTFALALGLASTSHAASLGTVNVLSSLGEPLQAEIEIFGLTDDEAKDLDIALAPESHYETAGSERSALMESIKLSIIQQGPRRMVQLHTDKPLAGPVYGLLLELRANGEPIIGEFALLPEEAAKPAETVITTKTAEPNDAAEAAHAAHAAEPVRPAEESAAAAAAAAASEPTTGEEIVIEVAGKGSENLALSDREASGNQHWVQRGENLTVIARQHGIADADLIQFVTATFKDNPAAFGHKNLHYLKTGAVLALPSEEVVRLVDEKAARKDIIAQWENFRSLLPAADGTKESTQSDSTQANRTSSRKVGAGSASPSLASGDRLTLAKLKADSDAAGKTDEDAIATKKAADEANERIRLLEKNILDLKTTIQPDKAPSGASEKSDTSDSSEKENSFWGILASPARDLMMQAATVLLLAALVVVSLVRRNAK